MRKSTKKKGSIVLYDYGVMTWFVNDVGDYVVGVVGGSRFEMKGKLSKDLS